MIFVTLEHILTHISFSIISVVIIIQLMTFFVHEIPSLSDSLEKGMIATFFSITGLLIIRLYFLFISKSLDRPLILKSLPLTLVLIAELLLSPLLVLSLQIKLLK